MALLDHDVKRVRNNAVGLSGDLTKEHPGTVIEYSDRIAACLEDNNVQARINATIALLRAGEADPGAIPAQRDALRSVLRDPSPEMRANVCVLTGNANVPGAVEELRGLKENDLNETVRERTAWAMTCFD